MKRNKNTIIIFLFIVFELIFVNEVSYAGSLQGPTRGKKQITSRSSSLSSPSSSLGSTAGMTSGATPGLTSGSTSSSSSGSTKASTSGSTSSSSSGGLQDTIRKNSPITSPDEDEEDSESSSSGGLQDAIRKNSPIKSPSSSSSSSSSSGSSSGTISGAAPNTGTSASSIQSAANSFIQRGKSKKIITIDEVLDVLLPVGQTIEAIAVLVLIIVGLILGVKYMLSGADEKAKMKQKLIWYVVSAVVVFGVVGIYNLIAEIVNSVGI